MVVVFSPRFDLRSGVVKVQEPTLVEACDTNTGIEVLDENVIGGFTSTAKIQNDAHLHAPIHVRRQGAGKILHCRRTAIFQLSIL
jgi:hypothetical protein